MTEKVIRMDKGIEVERKELKEYIEELKEIEEAVKNETDCKEGFQKIVKGKRRERKKIREIKEIIEEEVKEDREEIFQESENKKEGG